MKIVLVNQPDSRIGPEADRVSEKEAPIDFWSIIAEIKAATAESSGPPPGAAGPGFDGDNKETAEPDLPSRKRQTTESKQESGPESNVEVAQQPPSGAGPTGDRVLPEGSHEVVTWPERELARTLDSTVAARGAVDDSIYRVDDSISAGDRDALVVDRDEDRVWPGSPVTPGHVVGAEKPHRATLGVEIVHDDPTIDKDEDRAWVGSTPVRPVQVLFEDEPQRAELGVKSSQDDPVAHGGDGRGWVGSISVTPGRVLPEDKPQRAEFAPRELQSQDAIPGVVSRSGDRSEEGVEFEPNDQPQTVRRGLRSSRGTGEDARFGDRAATQKSTALTFESHPPTSESGVHSIRSRYADLGSAPSRSVVVKVDATSVDSSSGSKGNGIAATIGELPRIAVDSDLKSSAVVMRPDSHTGKEPPDTASGRDTHPERSPSGERSEVMPVASTKSPLVESLAMSSNDEGESTSWTRPRPESTMVTKSDSSSRNDGEITVESDTRRLNAQGFNRLSETGGEEELLNEKLKLSESPAPGVKDPISRTALPEGKTFAPVPQARIVADGVRPESNSRDSDVGVSEEEELGNARKGDTKDVRSERSAFAEDNPELFVERGERRTRKMQVDESIRRIPGRFNNESAEQIHEPESGVNRERKTTSTRELERPIEQPAQRYESKSQVSSNVPHRIAASEGSPPAQSEKLSSAPLVSAPVRENKLIMRLAGRIRSMVANGQGLLRVQLEPAEFGRMEIRAQQGVRGIMAQIVLESETVRSLLESRLHILQQSFADQGLRFDKVQIILQNDQSSSQSGSGEQYRESESDSEGSDSNPSGSAQDGMSGIDTVPEETGADSRVPGGFHTIA